jgi:hypothetical protein
MACVYSTQIGIADIIISILLVVIFLVQAAQKKKRFPDTISYQYYFFGFLFKLFSVCCFILLFIFYYGGGDTIDYHTGSIAMRNLFYESPLEYFDLMFNKITWEKYINYFNGRTCYPPTWMIKKESNFTVIRVASFIQLFLPNAILATNIIFARIAYGGIFRLYNLFCTYFPGKEKSLAIAFLFMPSVAFWGSGIMKDTLALTGICWLIILSHKIFIKNQFSVLDFLGFGLSIYIIFTVKTYLLLALLPGLIIWFNFQSIAAIKNAFVKVIIFPVIFIGSAIGMLSFYAANSALFGVYGPDSILQEAAKVQQDLIREESYGSNSFDIGAFQPTIAGISSKIGPAINAGLFRPFILESGGSPTMILAGLENLILLIMFIWALFKTRFLGFLPYIFSHPLLILGFVFTILLAFSIGLTSANFGALVRYKVPLVPFFTSILLLAIQSRNKEV